MKNNIKTLPFFHSLAFAVFAWTLIKKTHLFVVSSIFLTHNKNVHEGDETKFKILKEVEMKRIKNKLIT